MIINLLCIVDVKWFCATGLRVIYFCPFTTLQYLHDQVQFDNYINDQYYSIISAHTFPTQRRWHVFRLFFRARENKSVSIKVRLDLMAWFLIFDTFRMKSSTIAVCQFLESTKRSTVPTGLANYHYLFSLESKQITRPHSFERRFHRNVLTRVRYPLIFSSWHACSTTCLRSRCDRIEETIPVEKKSRKGGKA